MSRRYPPRTFVKRLTPLHGNGRYYPLGGRDEHPRASEKIKAALIEILSDRAMPFKVLERLYKSGGYEPRVGTTTMRKALNALLIAGVTTRESSDSAPNVRFWSVEQPMRDAIALCRKLSRSHIHCYIRGGTLVVENASITELKGLIDSRLK